MKKSLQTNRTITANGTIMGKEDKIVNVIIHSIFIVLCAVILYSFLIILTSSFQTQDDIMQNGYSIFPKEFSFAAYTMIINNPKMLLDAYGVTIITTIIGSILGVAIVASFAYSISRKKYKYAKLLSFYIFFTMMFNGGLVPSYILIANWLHLKDNILVLILPSVVSTWFIILLKGYFRSIPEALIESAKMDGASEFSIFIKIVLPISTPSLATIGLFYVLGYWNDWWLSMMYIESDNLVKLQYLLVKILKNIEFLNSAEALQLGAYRMGVEAPTLSARMAMCVLATGPVLIVFPFFQKYFVKGLTVGAVKG